MRLKLLLGVLFMSAIFLWLSPRASQAAFLRFDPESANATTSDIMTTNVIVDAGSDQLSGADVYIKYDPTALEIADFSNGTYFTAVTKSTPSSGILYISGYMTDTAKFATGAGTLATIKFRPLKGGTTVVSYNCNVGQSGSSKIIKNNANADNVIECTVNRSYTLTVAGGTNSTPTPTPTSGTSNPAPTSTPVPYQTNNTNYNPPAELPRSGVMDNMFLPALAGLFFLMFGGILKFSKYNDRFSR
jgi:hypothetical protein